MEIESLWIRNFRCIEDDRAQRIGVETWLVGPNASGKTSLLEAIYVLLRGQTFLSSRHGPLVRNGADSAVLGCLVRTEAERRLSLSCSVVGRACQARIDGEEIPRQSLTERVGVARLFGANAQELVSGEPRIRRDFVDWNLFHVEPSYRMLLARYSRLLAQRNAALKQARQPVSNWDAELAQLGNQIRAYRESYLIQLKLHLAPIQSRLLGTDAPMLSWSHGWSSGDGLEIALRRTADSDRRRGFTQCGPHRFVANLAVDALRLGSRGEQKLLAAVLHIACEALYQHKTGRTSVWLVDDATSELTESNGRALVDALRSTGAQMLLTELASAGQSTPDRPSSAQMFHVEHGSLFRSTPPLPASPGGARFPDLSRS